MKKVIFFKTLVDILFFLHLIGLLVIAIIIPLGGIDIDHSTLPNWGIAGLSMISYVVFLRGLYYLRKVAVFILNHKYFTENIIINIKKSGVHMLVTGGIFFLSIVVLWLQQLSDGKLSIGFDNHLVAALFLSAIGMFFILQSNTLLLAKAYKEENELTV